MKSGIYRIRNIETGHVYIGSAKNFSRRKNSHYNRLRAGDHANSRLQRAWGKYGEDSFIFEIIEYVDIELLISREQIHIDNVFGSNCYNIAPVAQSALGVRWSEAAKLAQSKRCVGREVSEETKLKLSKMLLGRIVTDATRKRMSDAFRGHMVSEETKNKISDKAKGRVISEETRSKISAAGKGRRMSETAITALSNRMKGNTNFAGKAHSEETKAKISAGNKGKIITDEQRSALSAKLTGRKRPQFSEQHRENLAASARAMWQRRRDAEAVRS